MKKIIFSLAIIAAIGAIVVGATTAYFSDTETSTGNTFTAGNLDLKIDSTCHYNGMVCSGGEWVEDNSGTAMGYPIAGTECSCTWEAKDLNGDRFFDFRDVKPGDAGENTLSFHVYNNDAYGRFRIDAIENRENGCTEPEHADDSTCYGRWCGELAQNTNVTAWIDEGDIEGWQGQTEDPTEGDNIHNGAYERVLYTGPLYPAYLAENTCAQMTGSASQDDANLSTGWIEVGDKLIGNTTYYIGVAWNVPFEVGNEIQGDSMKANIKFEIEQARHNTAPFDN